MVHIGFFGLVFRDVIPKMEGQVQRNMKNRVETG